MAAPADAIFVDGAVHVRPGEDRTEEALAVRDGTVCRVADTYEVEFLEGIETRRVDLDGHTVIPGFVDGYADLSGVGQHLREADEGGSGAPPADADAAREILGAAFDSALEQGITTVYDAVRYPETARAYHELALADELPIRVGLIYRENAGSADGTTPLEAARRLGLVSDVGTDRLWIESLAVDTSDRSVDGVREFHEQAIETGFHISTMIDDVAALDSLLPALAGADASRPRLWLDGSVSEEQLQALTDLDVTVAGRPDPVTEGAGPGSENGGGQSRGPPFGRLVAAGVPVAFGSNGPLPNPLRDIERATGAGPDARLGVTEALRAATGATGRKPRSGSPIGSLDVGTPADFVVLSASPWETPIADLAVELTVVDGTIEYVGSSIGDDAR